MAPLLPLMLCTSALRLDRRAMVGGAAVSLLRPRAASAEPPTVADPNGVLSPVEATRLDRILRALEAETGYRVRVATVAYASETTMPSSSDLARALGVMQGNVLDPNAVLMVASRGIPGKLENGGSYLRYEVGDNVKLLLPGVYWGRLQREYGKMRYVETRGEAAAIVTSCELIITCLRNEDFCTDVPSAESSFF